MIEFITQNAATIIVGAVVALLLALAVRAIVVNHRKSGCAGGCPGCGGICKNCEEYEREKKIKASKV